MGTVKRRVTGPLMRRLWRVMGRSMGWRSTSWFHYVAGVEAWRVIQRGIWIRRLALSLVTPRPMTGMYCTRIDVTNSSCAIACSAPLFYRFPRFRINYLSSVSLRARLSACR